MRSQMEIFNEAAAGILAAIYDRHPIPYSFAVCHAFQGVSAAEIPVYMATIQWLVDEGFLRCNRDTTCPGKDFLEMRLSLQGLTILNQALPGLPEDQPGILGELLINEVKNGRRVAAEVLVKHALSVLALHATAGKGMEKIPVGTSIPDGKASTKAPQDGFVESTAESCIAIARRVQSARYLAEDPNGSDAARQVADFIEEELLNSPQRIDLKRG